MEDQKRRKLTKLADKMLDAHDKADALSNIETGNEFGDTIGGILDSFAPLDLSTNDYIEKTKKAISLVKTNIKLAPAAIFSRRRNFQKLGQPIFS